MPCGDFPIEGRVAVVTGGGSGINLAFAKLATNNGAKGVIIADLRLTDDAQKFVDQNQGKVIFAKCDVTKRKDLESLVTVSVEKFETVPDVYIAGAGVFEPAWSNWWDDTEDDRYAEIDINVTHGLKLARIAMRSLLQAKKKGVFLVVASLAGYQGTFGAPLYCASKHAVIGFIRSMAPLDELEGIKMVAVAPGLVHTPLWTDRPNVMQNFGYDENLAVTPDFVAEKMMDLVVKGEYGGGSSLEVSASGVRTLGTWSIPPPAGMGTRVPNEATELSYKPLKAVIEKDKQAHSTK